MMDVPRIISVDDHVLEPPDLWASRLPARYRDRGPRVIRQRLTRRGGGRGGSVAEWVESDDGQWCDVWHYDGLVSPLMRLFAAAGFETKDFSAVTFEDLRPGAWIQKDRLLDMDMNHVDAAICFPNTLPRFCGQTFYEGDDKELGLLCVQAYNDWVIDEWSAGAGRGRLIPVAILPLWDARLAAAEIARCAEKGCFAISFPENPYPLGLPSLHDRDRFWDPVFKACEDARTVLCMHIGSSSQLPSTAPDAPFVVSGTLLFQNAMGSLVDFLSSGILERFPGLVIAYSEAQVGWMPYILERADKRWAESGGSYGAPLAAPPSSYVKDRIYGCIFDDDFGLLHRDSIGIDQICFETDYPHADSTFPHSKDVLAGMAKTADLSDDELYKLARGNAIRAFGLGRFGVTA